ncbi:hypothetical protein RRF57_006079 [Xylaria bambusicola]|uniref:Uncharacterized protein n=1 Tax=Xylaria bambusicola TaxID=326684 RepID=A0AAN7UYW3_9PEZI
MNFYTYQRHVCADRPLHRDVQFAPDLSISAWHIRRLERGEGCCPTVWNAADPVSFQFPPNKPPSSSSDVHETCRHHPELSTQGISMSEGESPSIQGYPMDPITEAHDHDGAMYVDGRFTRNGATFHRQWRRNSSLQMPAR